MVVCIRLRCNNRVSMRWERYMPFLELIIRTYGPGLQSLKHCQRLSGSSSLYDVLYEPMSTLLVPSYPRSNLISFSIYFQVNSLTYRYLLPVSRESYHAILMMTCGSPYNAEVIAERWRHIRSKKKTVPDLFLLLLNRGARKHPVSVLSVCCFCAIFTLIVY